MNSILLVIIFVAVVIFVMKMGKRLDSQPAHLNKKRPNRDLKPKLLAENDKIVVVTNINEAQASQAIEQFCNLYNKESFVILPSLTTLKENEHVITFPYDIDLDILCFLVNYIKYADELSEDTSYQPEIVAWTTLSKKSKLIKDDLVGNKAIIYIPNWDNEYDNIYLTTSANECYKVDFSISKKPSKMEAPILEYLNCDVDTSTLMDSFSKQFE
jgi:hypothetical protein